MTWQTAFFWTLVLELPIYALAIRSKLSLRAFFLVVLGGNALTHPIVWQLVPRFESYDLALVVMESFAIVVEGLILGFALSRAQMRHAWLLGWSIAAAANLFSAIVGPIVITALESS